MASKCIHGSLENTPKIPIVDFSCTSDWRSICSNVRKALEEYGCFEAVYGHEISLKLHTAMFSGVEEVFNLPHEFKCCYTDQVLPEIYGYSKPSERVPFRESIDIKEPSNFEELQSFLNLMCPSANESFCETMISYTRMLSEIDAMVKKMVFDEYGVVNKYYDSHMKSSTYRLRLMKYEDPQFKETYVGVKAHFDRTLLTILHQNEVNGLQIQAKDGTWIQVNPPPSSFIVLAGQAFTVWSNGRIKAPIHRVIVQENKARFTIGLFSYNHGTIETPEELVDEQHPSIFKPFNPLQSLLAYYQEV